jgi:hypothetical protein
MIPPYAAIEAVKELARERIAGACPNFGNIALEVVAQAVSPAIPDSFTASILRVQI